MSNSIAEFTATANGGRINGDKIDWTNNTWFICSRLKADSNLVQIDSAGIGAVRHSGSDNYEIIGRKTYYSPGGKFGVVIRDMRDSNWTKVYVDWVMAINMTQLGIEDYTEEQMLSLVRNGYFEGMKSTTLVQRIKSTGKNLISKEDLINYAKKYGTSGYSILKDGGMNVIELTPSDYNRDPLISDIFKNNTQYTITMKAKMVTGNSLYIRARYTDDSFSNLSCFVGTSYTSKTGITSNGKTVKYIYLSYGDTGYKSRIDLDSIQLEEGTTSTPYEPYKEDKTYISCTDSEGNIEELRSLPNGVKDEVKDGKLYKKIIKYIIQRNDITEVYNGNPDVSVARLNIIQVLNLPTGYFIFNSSRYLIEGYSKVPSGINISNITTEHIDMVAHSTGSGYLDFIFTKGTTLTQAKDRIEGVQLIYQLTKPTITPLENITPLQIWKNGTISIEPYLRKSIKYTNGKLTFPVSVSYIDKISDINNNEINLNNVLLASNGTYATIKGANDNEIFTVYAPIKPELSTIPSTAMSFPMNTKAQIKSNCKGVQQLGNNIITLQDTMAMFIVKNA